MSTAILAGVLVTGAVFAEGGRYAGRPLSEVLVELKEAGLRVVFTSSLVRPEMRVEDEPRSALPRDVLLEVLAPHGLTCKAGPGGRLVVVRGLPAEVTLQGKVVDRRSGAPVAGAQVLLEGSGLATVADDDGTYRLADVEPGGWTVTARHADYVVHREAVHLGRRGQGGVYELALRLDPTPLTLESIVVTPSRATLLADDPVVALALDRDEILALPHFGDDVFRSLTLLPGVSGEEVSAAFNVRGGRADELLVLFDRVEIYDPYHLKDFSRGLSIIAPRALGEVDLITGGFPAEYGDRMSGVLTMSSRLPAQERRTFLGASVINAEAGGSGTFAGGRGLWFAVSRLGALDLTLDFLGKVEKPEYWDAFGKVEIQAGAKQNFAVHALYAGDRLDYNPGVDDEGDRERFLTDYESTYVWLNHRLFLSRRLFADTVLSLGRVERDRRGQESEPDDLGYSVRDARGFDAVGLKQDWSFQPNGGNQGGRHYLKWGFDGRHLEAEYDYLNDRELEDPLAEIRSEPRTGITRLLAEVRSEPLGVYVADRWQPVLEGTPLTLEAGLRWDSYNLTSDGLPRASLPDEDLVSPRFNLVWALGRSATLRAAWGHFYQSQRPYELQVDDGESSFFKVERTEHQVVGFERVFHDRGLTLRLEAYQRRITSPRVRYINLFEPISTFPEIEPDRFRVRPELSRAEGVELFVRGRAGKRVDWWVNYAYARVKDRVDGRDRPRRFDQPNTLNADLNVRVGEHWNVNVAFRHHTGWPATRVTAAFADGGEDDGAEDDGGEDDGGEDGGGEDEVDLVPVFGPIHGERLPEYHRLDLRASRQWRSRHGTLTFFVEVQNVYDRENVAGYDVDFEFFVDEDGGPAVEAIHEIWGGVQPSFGIVWEF